MARNRMIQKTFWDDEKISQVSKPARLVFIALWNLSDDYGVVKGNSMWLKNRIFPYDNDDLNDFTAWINELLYYNFIIPFTSSNSESYYFIKNFSKHQTINKPSEKRNPEPPDNILEECSDTTEPLPSEVKLSKEEVEVKDKGKKTVDYPPWLDLPLWKEFKKYRTKIKAPLTEHGEKLCLADLKKMIDEGHRQDEIVNQTIMSGKWKSFFPVRNKTKEVKTVKQPECSKCGQIASSIKRGQECPFCGEIA